MSFDQSSNLYIYPRFIGYMEHLLAYIVHLSCWMQLDLQAMLSYTPSDSIFGVHFGILAILEEFFLWHLSLRKF
jgi:hypothetical protein